MMPLNFSVPSSASGSRSPKTHLKAHANYVCITHPAHPLRGQSFPIIADQKQKNPDLIEIQLTDGERRFMPLAWTDQVPPLEVWPEVRFLPTKLLILRQQLDGLLPLIEAAGTLSPKAKPIAGGSDELSQPVHLVSPDQEAAGPGDSPSGPAGAASTAEKRKGG
jgi:hypothetical protein